MRYHFISACIACIGILYITGCESTHQKEERLAKQYCASCHAFPEPGLLTKKIWHYDIMPQMAFRMGFEDMKLIMQLSDEDRNIVLQSLPDKPMLSQEEFDAIRHYYERLAPDSLTLPPVPATQPLTQFDVTTLQLPEKTLPFVTLVKADTLHQNIYIGTRLSKLYTFSDKFVLKDSLKLESPLSDMIFYPDSTMMLFMGMMDPNDLSKGKLASLHNQQRPVLEGLQRPVHIQQTDLNNDGLTDYIVCGFGNYTGALQAYENLGNNRYKKHTLIQTPGARNTVIEDIDHNGLPDITVLMTQGDERIIMLLNQGGFDFRVNTVLRFPPVYGSAYFELVDFNGDGKKDIVYINGDNADYSITFKPYHGIRIFQNDGTNHFEETWFYPLYGAFQSRTADYDQDGDLDIAAISFFPDFVQHPENGFIYLENTGKGFTAYTTPLAGSGKWITLDAADIDQDHDIDILLGALDFEFKVPPPLLKQWHTDRTSVLVLKNTLHGK
ncbi:MAG TPA: VCBS repeat-containing protein [Ohtaekwangia sp.]|uniref:FG-GAP repeat domain-containing protein n=1 Tax=Ohtaekwangia sp. TaxID=2066019 RepID=UPI002F929A50